MCGNVRLIAEIGCRIRQFNTLLGEGQGGFSAENKVRQDRFMLRLCNVNILLDAPQLKKFPSNIKSDNQLSSRRCTMRVPTNHAPQRNLFYTCLYR